jgi:uncharacterized protein (DUF4415 family)
MARLREDKTGQAVLLPTPEEDAAISAAAAQDQDNPELDAAFFRNARAVSEVPELVAILHQHGKLGRPPLPPDQRKRRVTLHLDPEVLDRLKADGRGWQTRANAALRRALGLD